MRQALTFMRAEHLRRANPNTIQSARIVRAVDGFHHAERETVLLKDRKSVV